MKLWKIFPVVVLVLTMVVSVSAQSLDQQIGNYGSVDWADQKISATGIGSPNPALPETAQRATAIRAAKLDGLRNLLETVKGVNLTSETTVANFMVQSDIITTRVNGMVRGFAVVNTRYMSTGDVEVTVEVPMNGVGGLGDVLLGPDMFGGQAPGQAMPTTPSAGTGVFTGIIVDARGLGLRPAMAPKIVDDSGQEVYGSKHVSREWAIKQGMVGYEKDVNRARTNDRVTNNPLLVKAVKVSGPNKADVVVSPADAAKIASAAATQKFLDECRVMFIVD